MYNRNAGDGLLSWEMAVSYGGATGAFQVKVSGDGKNVYVVHQNEHKIYWYTRAQDNGHLSSFGSVGDSTLLNMPQVATLSFSVEFPLEM